MRRELDIRLNRDRDYPFFSKEFYRRRWSWETTLSNEGPDKPFVKYKGSASFAVIGLIKAHFPSLFGKKVKPSP